MKITVVGAGPVGSYTSLLLKRYGFSPLIIEEHPEVGRPVQCAGIVGRDVFEDLVLPLSRRSIVNQIDGAIVYFGNDNFSIKKEGQIGGAFIRTSSSVQTVSILCSEGRQSYLLI
jgi:flavin-dependent dehydrogenase